jgi:hypothetical protein
MLKQESYKKYSSIHKYIPEEIMMVNSKNTTSFSMIFPLVSIDQCFLMEISAKSACTIITKMFFQHQNILEKALDYSNWFINIEMMFLHFVQLENS